MNIDGYFDLPLYTLTLLLFFCTTTGLGQTVLATGGTYAETEQGSLDWTIGEPVTATSIGQAGILSQGYHQPFLMITSIETVNRKQIALKLYPNPFRFFLHVELLEPLEEPLEAVLFLLNGQVLKRQRLEFRTLHSMDLRSLPAGTYQLSIYRNQILHKSFSIVKM